MRGRLNTQKRLRKIRKTFGDVVWARIMLMFFSGDARASATGASFRISDDDLVELAEGMPSMRIETHPYDPYIKWAAAQTKWVMKARQRAGIPRTAPSNQLGALRIHFSHIVDYIEAHPGVDLADLNLPQAIAASREWHRAMREAQDDERAALALAQTPSGVVLHRWPDGWTLERLDTEQQLQTEGTVMRQCVGGYYRRVSRGQIWIWSLRDPRGKPHLTVEAGLRGGVLSSIDQALGKANSPPKPAYVARLVEYLEAINFDLAKWGVVAGYLPPERIVERWRQTAAIPMVPGEDEGVTEAGKIVALLREFDEEIWNNESTPIEITLGGGLIKVHAAVSLDFLADIIDDKHFDGLLAQEGLSPWFAGLAERHGVDLEHAGHRWDLVARFIGQVLSGKDPKETVHTDIVLETKQQFAAPTYTDMDQFEDDIQEILGHIRLLREGLMTRAIDEFKPGPRTAAQKKRLVAAVREAERWTPSASDG